MFESHGIVSKLFKNQLQLNDISTAVLPIHFIN